MYPRPIAAALMALVLLIPRSALSDPLPDAGLREFDRAFFERCRVALAEPSLSVATKNKAAEAYRLFYLPSFRDHVSIRINIWSAGTGRVTWHRLNRSRCDPGDVDERTHSISPEDVARLREAMAQAGFWSMVGDQRKSGEEQIVCSDGVGAFLEGVNDGRHHVVSRHCVWNSKFQKVVDLFHELARTKAPDHGALILD
jgi:hypothetical protein